MGHSNLHEKLDDENGEFEKSRNHRNKNCRPRNSFLRMRLARRWRNIHFGCHLKPSEYQRIP